VAEVYPESLSIEQDHPSHRLDEPVLRELVRHVIAAEEATLVHVSVVLTGHDTVRPLNREYLDHDYNTDVLSFSLRDEPRAPAEEAAGVEGEVYVDLDTAAERHDEFENTFEEEAYRYVVHGVLHLLGYDDATDAGQDTMRKKEDEYLGAVLSGSAS